MSGNQTQLQLQDEHEPAGAPINLSLAALICYDRGGLRPGAWMALRCAVIVIGISTANRSRQYPADAVAYSELALFDRYGPHLAGAGNG
jgi:hypothetical protein